MQKKRIKRSSSFISFNKLTNEQKGLLVTIQKNFSENYKNFEIYSKKKNFSNFDLKKITSIKLDCFLELEKLTNLKNEFVKYSEERSYLQKIFIILNNQYKLIIKNFSEKIEKKEKTKNLLNSLISPEETISEKMTKLKDKEENFSFDINCSNLEDLENIVSSYISILDIFSTSIFLFSEDLKKKNFDFGKVYAKITNKIPIDGFSLFKLDKVIKKNQKKFLKKFLKILNLVLEFKNEKENLLDFLCGNLIIFSKGKNMQKMQKDISNKLFKIFNKNFDLKIFFKNFKKIIPKKKFNKKPVSFLFCEIFINFNRIINEMAIFKKYSKFSLDQFYKFFFFLYHIKIVLEILFLLIFNVNEIKLDYFISFEKIK